MTKISDKIAGKTKQLVAEVTGDGKLQEEGKRQEKKPELPKPEEEKKADTSTIANNLT
jgi:uncharacterized protein YjbJ (UPF0337 family)